MSFPLCTVLIVLTALTVMTAVKGLLMFDVMMLHNTTYQKDAPLLLAAKQLLSSATREMHSCTLAVM